MHGCSNSVIPRTRRAFWTQKLEGNQSRDRRNARNLRRLGWRVRIVWECKIRDDILSTMHRISEVIV